jgi:TIR domain-containing protein
MPVFISHSQKDQPSYSSLCLALDGRNVARWDPTELAAGESLADQLRRAIVQCDVCIFLATAQSLDSRWCLAELGAFWGAGKKVIIYFADPKLKESEIPPQFHGTLWTKDAKQLLSSVIQIMNKASADAKNSLDSKSVRCLLADSLATGVRRIFRNRLALDLNHDALNEKINSANVVNIASLVFNVQQSRDLKRSLERCVRNGGRVRILLSDASPVAVSSGVQARNFSKSTNLLWPLRLRQYAEKDLSHNRMPTELRAALSFLGDLREDLRKSSEHDLKGFEVRLLSHYVMYMYIMQIDATMIVTFYSNKQQGNGSPTLRLEKGSDAGNLFVLFEEEFNYLWETAKPADEL